MLKIKNPFRLEEYRTQLAKKRNHKKFKDTYTASHPHIEDTNSPTFWDKEKYLYVFEKYYYFKSFISRFFLMSKFSKVFVLVA